MLRALILGAFALLLSAPSSKNQVLCEGFLPENKLNISVFDPAAGPMKEQDFNSVLDEIEKYYTPVIAAKGGSLVVNRKWSDGTVNASANQSGRTWFLNMYGGLARHPSMNKDGFMLVACHEIGHHIGGAPKIASWWPGGAWATNEGGADYFASLRCLRAMFQETDNVAFVLAGGVDASVQRKCEQIYDTQSEENLCMRIAMAGYTGAMLFQTLHENPNALSFTTPDQNVVSRMYDDHPEPQCRLDTYYQGGLCRHDMNVELSNSDATVGTCNVSAGQSEGVRPLCWYKP